MKDEIRALEVRRYEAMLRGDVDALAALFSERAVYAHSDATRDSKAEYLASLSTGSLRYLKIGHTTEMVLEAGPDAAAAIGRMDASIIRNGAEKCIASLTLAVWVREGGEWRLLAYQPTAMKA